MFVASECLKPMKNTISRILVFAMCWWVPNLRMDIEKLLENVVYLHLCSQGYQVTVGQLQNGEVDFVAERGGDRLYVQVTYLLATQETMDREFGNLRRIKDDYPKKVVCMDALAAEGNYEGIECVHVREFLKGVIALFLSDDFIS